MQYVYINSLEELDFAIAARFPIEFSMKGTDFWVACDNNAQTFESFRILIEQTYFEYALRYPRPAQRVH